jgi:prophage regulatory protein
VSSIRPLYLDIASVAGAVSLSISTVEKLVREEAFPAPRMLSGRRVAWLLSEVEAWCEQRPVSNLPPPHNAGRSKTAKLPVEQVARGELRAG